MNASSRLVQATDYFTEHYFDIYSTAAILFDANNPGRYIIYDGNEYWLVDSIGGDWALKKEYKGLIERLIVCSWCDAVFISNIPFKIGFGSPDQANKKWKDVNPVICEMDSLIKELTKELTLEKVNQEGSI